MNKVFRSDIAAQVASEASFPPTFGPFDDFSNWRALNTKIWGKKEDCISRTVSHTLCINSVQLHNFLKIDLGIFLLWPNSNR